MVTSPRTPVKASRRRQAGSVESLSEAASVADGRAVPKGILRLSKIQVLAHRGATEKPTGPGANDAHAHAKQG